MAADVYMWALVKTKHTKMETRKQSLIGLREDLSIHGISFALTFAGPGALKPPVTSVSAAGTSTILIPSTARSTTTDSTGFLEHDTLWAGHAIA